MRHPGDLPARRGHHLSNEGVQLLNKSNGKREWEQQTIYLPPALSRWGLKLLYHACLRVSELCAGMAAEARWGLKLNGL